MARLRREMNMTQLELSRQAGKNCAPLDRAAIAKIEVGLRQVRDYELLAIAKAMRVSPLWLLTGRRR